MPDDNYDEKIEKMVSLTVSAARGQIPNTQISIPLAQIAAGNLAPPEARELAKTLSRIVQGERDPIGLVETLTPELTEVVWEALDQIEAPAVEVSDDDREEIHDQHRQADRDVLESLSIASGHNPRPVVMFSEAGDQGFGACAVQCDPTQRSRKLELGHDLAGLGVDAGELVTFVSADPHQVRGDDRGDRPQHDAAPGFGLGAACAQVLLTESDFEDRLRYLNLHRALGTLLAKDVVRLFAQALEKAVALIGDGSR